MVRKCCECGKSLKYFDKWRLVSSNERMCIPCYEKYQKEQGTERIKAKTLTENYGGRGEV